MTELAAARDEAQRQLVEASKAAFDIGSRELFARHGDVGLISFQWQQYTPYWNDGDTTEFMAMTYDVHVNGIDPQWPDEHAWEGSGSLPSAADLEPLVAARNDVRAVLQTFEDDLLLAMFGDHVKVKVTPERAVAEYYDHE